MATKRLLVDAIHPEETRIVVTSGNRLEEFDFESAQRRQLRGNIYLAKVTRVEPSLQAAFVEYGGNRHGFLAFSEIHPDYYQIPVADREALLRDEEAEAAADAADDSNEITEASGNGNGDGNGNGNGDDNGENGDHDQDADHIEQAPANTGPVESVGSGDALEELPERRKKTTARRNAYKIQEVIKRRQVMLVQVVKEERGNKGAALTTYLSLAGRYSVLMPNTARGGGISRKITNAADRKRLKDIVGDLEVPQGQGIILRTAGASRTKAEVKRDFEYLQRLWENVRTLTLQSTAPCLVYEEGSLIKRTIRDLYNKDINEVLVAGEDAYREAKDFMRMIMPSHAKNVQLYKDDQPIFSKYNVEGQLDQMFSPQVTLPSGGYIVINPTEALVSIDVNSGRATKEHNIEDTALHTNLEAAEEIARQLRLRDLAGLIVIDFIDMMENRSNRAVERKLKDCLKNDRARIQVGRISHFGLLEMSRQRIRFGVVESSTHRCPTCQGTGLVRSVESLALLVMRNIEDHVLRKPGQSINVRMPTDVALYVLNTKRASLSNLEAKYGLSINVIADDEVGPSHYAIERGENRTQDHRGDPLAANHVRVDTASMAELDDAGEEAEASEANGHDENGERSGRRRRRRGRGRGGDRDERQLQAAADGAADADGDEDQSANGQDAEAANREDSEEPRKRRRRGRRGGRRNRRNGEDMVEHAEAADAAVAATTDGDGDGDGDDTVMAPDAASAGAVDEAASDVAPEAPAAQEPVADAPVEEPAAEKPKRARRTRKAADAVAVVQDAPVEAAAETPADSDPPAEPAAEPATKPKRTRKSRAKPTDAATETAATAAVAPDAAEPAPEPQPDSAPPAPAAEEPDRPARRARKTLPADEIVVSSTTPEDGDKPAKPKKAGWWQRGFLGG